MLKAVFTVFVSIHGLIHLLGFAKEWRLSDSTQVSGKTLFHIGEGASKAMGVLWLLACLIFLASASAYALKIEWWWMIVAVGLIVSQTLIVIYWVDAKFGTIANIIIFTAIILSLWA